MTGPKTILVVDDDDALRGMLVEQLALVTGWRTRGASTGADAVAQVLSRDACIDVVLLDLELPDADGRELCALLRQRGVRVPVVIMTGSVAEADVVSALDAGANDYVFKPLRLGELVARLRAQLRAYESSEDVAYRIGPYLFRPAARTLQETATGKRIRLTDKEAAMLRYLYAKQGAAVARHTLLREVWGYSPDADSHTVETHIYRLRRKIEPDPRRITILVNDGGGYRLALDGAPTFERTARLAPMSLAA